MTKHADMGEKLSQALALRESGLTLKQISEQVGVAVSTVSRWMIPLTPEPVVTAEMKIASARAGDKAVVLEFVRDVIQLRRRGVSVLQIARLLDSNKSTVCRAIKNLCDGMFESQGLSKHGWATKEMVPEPILPPLPKASRRRGAAWKYLGKRKAQCHGNPGPRI